MANHLTPEELSKELGLNRDDVIQAIHGKEPLVADGRAGWRVVRILEAAQRSMEGAGVVVSPNANVVKGRA